MRVSVFGLGYVGCVTAGALTELGHTVIGVDVNPAKVRAFDDGLPPVSEPGLEALFQAARADGRLSATEDSRAAVRDSELSLICVGTPSSGDGSPDLSALAKVAEEIGRGVAAKDRHEHVIVIRSTTPPGTLQNLVMPRAVDVAPEDHEISFVSNPEFLREGSALKDFFDPPFILVGTDSDAGRAAMERLYEGVEAPLVEVPVMEAEMVKLVSNSFHALKVTFANEIGNICVEAGVDGRRVMETVCMDTKLNISPRYMMPGFAFGGSCLPKDVRATMALGRRLGVVLPLLGSLEQSNEAQIRRAFQKIQSLGHRNVGMVGLAFKKGTDDLRESPFVSLAEILHGKGYSLSIYDPDIDLDALVGTNRQYVEQSLPHIHQLMRPSLREVLDASDVLVLAHDYPDLQPELENLPSGMAVIDLTDSVDLGEHQDLRPLWSNARTMQSS